MACKVFSPLSFWWYLWFTLLCCGNKRKKTKQSTWANCFWPWILMGRGMSGGWRWGGCCRRRKGDGIRALPGLSLAAGGDPGAAALPANPDTLSRGDNLHLLLPREILMFCLLTRKWENEISNHLSVWVCVSVPFTEIFVRHRTSASQKIPVPGYDLSPRCPSDGLGCDSYKDQLCNVMILMNSSTFYTIKILMEVHPWGDCRAVSKQANFLPQLCSQASQDMSANITFQHSAVWQFGTGSRSRADAEADQMGDNCVIYGTPCQRYRKINDNCGS